MSELNDLVVEALSQPIHHWDRGQSRQTGTQPPAPEQVTKLKTTVLAAIEFVASAQVVARKPRIGKKGQSRYRHGANYAIGGLVACPVVVLRIKGGSELRMMTEFDAAPFKIDHEYDDKGRRVYKVSKKPHIPGMFLHADKPAYDMRILANNDHCQALVKWFLLHCPRLHELDPQVRQAWQTQMETLSEEVKKFIEKSSGKQRDEFQRKLAKEFESCKNTLAGMNPATVFEIFRFARDHSGDLENLVRFCRRNATDSIWVDESDVSAAMDLARVSEVMGA